MAGVPVVLPFVGREHERAIGLRALEAGQKGRGGLVLISGPAGLGKSRLIDQLVGEAEARGFRVRQGHAAEGDAVPYTAFRRALESEGRGGRTRPRGRGVAPSSRSETLPIAAAAALPSFPTLGAGLGAGPGLAVGSRVGSSGTWGDTPLGELLTSSDAREVKLEELPPLGAAVRLLDLLSQVAEGDPLLLVLDNFQWADPGSLALLRPFARDVRKRNLVVVVGFETDDAPSGGEETPALESLARAIQRESGATRIQLRGLSDDDVRKLAEEILQAPLILDKDGTLPPMLARADGNPFFVQEVLRAGLRDGWISRRGEGYRMREPAQELQVPTLLRWWVHRRITPLLPDDRTLLEAISILGSEFDPRALPTLLPEKSAQVKRGLERLQVRHGLLHPVRPGLWRVEPAFLASVVRAEMGGDVRRRLHRRAGEWQAAHDPQAVERIADHYFQAGEPSLALPWITRAWRAAFDRSDNELAARFARWGQEMGRAEGSASVTVEWKRREASALLQLGEVLRAQKALEEGLAQAPSGISRVAALTEMALLEMHTGKTDKAFAILDQATAEPVDPADQEQADVRIRAMTVDLYTRSQKWEKVAEVAPKLLAHGESLDERRRCRALSAYGTSLTALNRFAEARGALLESLSRARKAGLVAQEANARTTLGILAVLMGDLPVARAMFEQVSAEWGRRGGLTNQAINSGNAAEVMAQQGDTSSALAWLKETFRLAELASLASLHTELSPVLARLHLDQDEPKEAEEVLLPLFAPGRLEPGSDTFREAHATMARVLLARGDPESAWSEAQLAGPQTGGLVGYSVARTYAVAQAAHGEMAKAEGLLTSLVEETARTERRFERAQCLEALGDLYVADHRSTRARVCWDEALGLLRACGALGRAAQLERKRGRLAP